MIVKKEVYEKLAISNMDCARPIGGNCVGNCRRAPTNMDCMRPIGGNCVGNCRKSPKVVQLKW